MSRFLLVSSSITHPYNLLRDATSTYNVLKMELLDDSKFLHQVNTLGNSQLTRSTLINVEFEGHRILGITD